MSNNSFDNEDVKVVYMKPTIRRKCGSCMVELTKDLKCARCQNMFYCNVECQRSHWKTHKLHCVPYQSEGAPKPLPRVPAMIGPHISKEENQKSILAAIEKAKATTPDAADFICSTCQGPSTCLSFSELPTDGVGAAANATFVCGLGHLSAACDARMGIEHECHCNVTAQPTFSAPLTPQQRNLYERMVPTAPKLLVVIGFGQIDENNSAYMSALRPHCQQHGIAIDVLRASQGSLLAKKIESGQYNSVLFLHIDDGGMEKYGENMFNALNFGALYNLVRFGGKCIFHGEGCSLTEVLRILSGEPWHFCGDYYRRCTHHCNRTEFSHFPLTTSSSSSSSSGAIEDTGEEEDSHFILPRKIDVKATMLSGVSRSCQLYSPREGARCVSAVPNFGGHVIPTFRTAVAVSKIGNGLLCFFGDVNADVKTVNIITKIVALPKET